MGSSQIKVPIWYPQILGAAIRKITKTAHNFENNSYTGTNHKKNSRMQISIFEYAHRPLTLNPKP